MNAVLLKACAQKARERYQSAEEMTADLALLHSGKSVKDKQALERRLRIMTQVAVAIVAVMMLGVVPYYLAIKEARVARAAAKKESEQRQRAEAGEKKAETEAAKRREVAQFLKDTLEGVGPSVALGRDTTMLREILGKTAERVGNDLTN